MTIQRVMPVIAAVFLAGSVLADSAAQAEARTSLYKRLGGKPAITVVVNDMITNVAVDRRINSFFANADIPHLKMELVSQICQATGGPCVYTGKNMRTAHRGMGIRNRDFNALVQDLGKSLKKNKVPAREQSELVAILSPLRKDIVTR